MSLQSVSPTSLPAAALRKYHARRCSVLDSHTEGEPTRLVLDGGPDLGDGSVAAQLVRLQHEYPGFRQAVIAEPRGSDVLVGALLCRPTEPGSSAAVIFFNDAGYLGMCGHGTIGLVTSLAHMGRIAPGEHRIETPVGTVRTVLHEDGAVTVMNVPAYRWAADVSVQVPGLGRVTGDIAWGGNWFYLIQTPAPLPLHLEHVGELTRAATAVRNALREAGHTGAEGALVDHIEWFGPAEHPENDSRNFVLCPGAAYDRSPCGTGTSAKLACLAAAGALRPGQTLRQEGILGTVFTGRYATTQQSGRILPEVTGRAWITAETTLVFEEGDPFVDGIPAR